MASAGISPEVDAAVVAVMPAVEEYLTSAAQQRATTTGIVLGTALAGAAALALLGWLVGRSVSGPLRRTIVVLEGLAEGRLDLRLDADTKDEVGQMAAALQQVVGQFRT